MGKLNEIRNRLKAGDTPRQLIEKGYSRSSVYREKKKLNNSQPETTTKPVNNELQELRHQKEIIKIQKEIAEIEATKEKLPERVDALEKLPERVAALEKAMLDHRSLINDAVDTVLFKSLIYAGVNREEAEKFANGWVERNIKV